MMAESKPNAQGSSTPTPNLTRVVAHCLRCGYQWFPHAQHPKTCPNCRSRYWNQPRTYKLAGKPAPTRKAKARGATFSSETAQEAANIRHHGEPDPPDKPTEPDSTDSS